MPVTDTCQSGKFDAYFPTWKVTTPSRPARRGAGPGRLAVVVLPRGHDVAIGAAVAVQIATTALGLYVDALGPLGAGRRSGAVRGGRRAPAVALRPAQRGAGPGLREQGGLRHGHHRPSGYGVPLGRRVRRRRRASCGGWSALVSVAGGVVYVLSGRRWLRAYRQEPARLGRGSRPSGSPSRCALAVAGLVLLRPRALMADLDPHLQAPGPPEAGDHADRGQRGGVRQRARPARGQRLRALQAPRGLGDAGYVRGAQGRAPAAAVRRGCR